MLMETREGELKMVAEVPKNLETEAGELKFIESEDGATTASKTSSEEGGGGLVIAYAVAEVTKKIPSLGRNMKPQQNLRLQRNQRQHKSI